MERRSFIKTLAMATTVVSLPEMLSAQGKGKLPSFGLITGNTGGDWIKNHSKEALEEIARLGFKDPEFGGYFGMDVTGLKKILKQTGLRALIGPTSMHAMGNTEQLRKDIADCQELGKKFIVCYWPWTDDGRNKTLDDWKNVADQLNKGGEVCKKEGLRLLYHNHDIEFRPVQGEIPFDTLLPNLDPKLVNIELDLYWIVKGGQSAVDYIRKYPGRYPVFHVKDMDKTDNMGFACVGDGRIDFPEIFRHNKIAGAKHFIVEHDHPENPEMCIRTAANYLSNLKF
ncbi:MAG: sugar phosphate isomerase/epimerase [Bacteroidales bacterium]|jgi:sugar phosphate isomerase/epimerase|nr:sugar phosphate isomerase/epimerase [Bacteroidales bacterium]